VLAGREGKEGQWRLGKGPKSEQLTLSLGPERVGVSNYIQRASIPSKRLSIN
jgi:hypothetical protein